MPDGSAVSSANLINPETNNRIRMVDLATGVSTTLAGDGRDGQRDGPGKQARFSYPGGIGVGPDGTVYVGDYEASRIRQVVPPKQWQAARGLLSVDYRV